MYPLVESLRIQNGQVSRISYHNERMNRTRRELFGRTDEIDLADHIRPPGDIPLIKCRVEYQENILNVEYAPYQMRTIRSLQTVVCDDIDYQYKSIDRSRLTNLFDGRGECDDILIIRNGLVTDSSAANVAFWDGAHWITPAQPLLAGTNRAFLLDKGVICTGDIPAATIRSYEKVSLFNAMIDFGRIEIPVETIKGV